VARSSEAAASHVRPTARLGREDTMRTTDAKHGRTDEIRTRSAETLSSQAGLQSAATQKIARAGCALHRKGHLDDELNHSTQRF
jgi:hypothetical protein